MKRAVTFIVMGALATGAFAQTAADALTGQIEARSSPRREVSFVPAAPSNQPPIPFFKTHVVVFFFASTCPYWGSIHSPRQSSRRSKLVHITASKTKLNSNQS